MGSSRPAVAGRVASQLSARSRSAHGDRTAPGSGRRSARSGNADSGSCVSPRSSPHPAILTSADSATAPTGVARRRLRVLGCQFVASMAVRPTDELVVPASLTRHVLAVIAWCAEEEVVRPHTTRIVAAMEYPQPSRDLTEMHAIRHAVRFFPMAIAQVETPVALTRPGSVELPAARSLLDASPEPSRDIAANPSTLLRCGHAWRPTGTSLRSRSR
jgi:hypothetical protein